MKTKGFVKGAVILIIFNLIGKLVGAVYRIPLANILGSVGIGEYQLIFPLYSLLLAISISGIPIAISKIVAEYNSKNQFGDVKRLLKMALIYIFTLSLVCSGVVIAFSKFIARVQGRSEIYFCYYAIAPSVLFVGVLSVFRGYFQGNLKMMPTALSYLIEQIGKLVFGLYFTTRFIKNGVEYGVFGALLGISISEFLALIFLAFYYIFYTRKHKTPRNYCLTKRAISKQLIMTSLPITFGGISAPITAIIDSLLVVNLLSHIGFSSKQATSLLGLQSGIVDPILNIPIVIAVAISASLLPNLTKVYTNGDNDEVKNLIEKAFQITLSVALACSICFVIFGKQILTFLYSRSLTNYELDTATKLLFLGGINLILLSIVQVSAGILQGIGKQNLTVKSILVGSSVKIILTFALVSMKQINIYGAMISGAVSYLVVFMINYRIVRKKTSARITNVFFNVSIQECLVAFFVFFSNMILFMTFGSNAALFGGGLTAIIIFIITYYVLFMIDKPKAITS